MYVESNESKEKLYDNYQRIYNKYTNIDSYSAITIIKKIVEEMITTIKISGFKRLIFKMGCRINKKKIFDKHIPFDKNDKRELNYICKNDIGDGRIAVYTAIFGGYDEIQEPLYKTPCCDYYIFTDRDVSPNSIWKKIDINNMPQFKTMDAYQISKYIKIFPNIFFKDYEYSIWVDGTTVIVADLYPFVDRLENNIIGVFDNPVHDCIYTEANFLIYYNRVAQDVIKQQINFYKKEGYPAHNGMYECTIIVRQHMNNRCIKLMNDWWEQINKFSMRDQISFPFVLWKSRFQKEDVTILGNNRNYNPRFRFMNHLKTQKYK